MAEEKRERDNYDSGEEYNPGWRTAFLPYNVKDDEGVDVVTLAGGRCRC